MPALLAAGADVMARAENGETPLYGAADARNLAAVEVLLAAGADPMARGGPGWTPLHNARSRVSLMSCCKRGPTWLRGTWTA